MENSIDLSQNACILLKAIGEFKCSKKKDDINNDDLNMTSENFKCAIEELEKNRLLKEHIADHTIKECIIEGVLNDVSLINPKLLELGEEEFKRLYKQSEFDSEKYDGLLKRAKLCE